LIVERNKAFFSNEELLYQYTNEPKAGCSYSLYATGDISTCDEFDQVLG